MPDAPRQTTKAYRRYVLILLFVVYIFNFIDRQILVILQESIKADLGLSDTQLGLLTGFSFAVFYVTCGIPIARWSDIGNRRNILSASVAVWSAFTALSALVGNFWHLLLARIGVGIGEAGGTPPAHSLISDYYPPEQRARALSIYSMGIYIGILCGFLFGGWIDEKFGWRMAFVLVGVPGLLVALIVRLTIREPTRGQHDAAGYEAPKGSMLKAIRSMWALKSFRYASLGCASTTFMGYGMMNFMPSFAIRVYEMPVGEVGTWMALIIGITGAAAAFTGGYVADHMGRDNKRWYYYVGGVGALLSAPANLLVLWWAGDSPLWSALIVSSFCSSLFLPPVIAMAHELVGAQARALSSAFIYLVLNIIGLGLGPPTVGLVSDLLAPSMGIDSLRVGMSVACVVGFTAVGFFALAAQTLESDLEKTRARRLLPEQKGI